MDEKQKQLLREDLCGRLPYGVNVLHVKDGVTGVLSSVDFRLGNNGEGKQELKCTTSFFGEDNVPIEEFRPYLYPPSSVTTKQKAELSMLVMDEESFFKSLLIELEFYHRHHIDCRGLIPMGPAIDATGVVMYNKEREP